MTPLQAHHDLALMLLVGRSLPGGLPWTVDEDQTYIARERVLWAQLTPEEKEQASDDLRRLWGHRGAARRVKPDPSWGPWVEGLGPTVDIPDVAFGLSESAFRPMMKGIQVLIDERPDLATILGWLWERGFCPVDLEGETLVLHIPSHRIVQESERLVGMLTRDWVSVPAPSKDAPLWITGSYDPVTGRATIHLRGVTPEKD